MNVLSLFDGSLGTLTIFWLVLIVVAFIYALYRFLSKCGRIIRDCNSISYPTTEDTLNKTLVGRVILQNVKQGTTSSHHVLQLAMWRLLLFLCARIKDSRA